jgi:hypothetical protein
MGFPAKELKCSGGEMYSQIFENKKVGIKRDIFWSLTINFLPIRYYDDKEYNCSFMIEWMKFPFKNWTDLNGFQLKGNYGDNGCEASFYLVEHDCAKNFDIRFSYQKDNIFKVSFVTEIDFMGITEEDADPNLKISGETDIIYEGLWVLPNNLDKKPKNVSEITKIGGNFVELESYNEPHLDKNDFYLFSPKCRFPS